MEPKTETYQYRIHLETPLGIKQGKFTLSATHKTFLKKVLDIFRIHGIITNVPGRPVTNRKQNMRIWRNWQTR